MNAKDIARFEAKVDRSGGADTCHPWRGGTDDDGYGVIRLDGKAHKAHRVAFFLAHGRWPEPCGLHSCDNPPCCNVRHLFEGNCSAEQQGPRAQGQIGAHPWRAQRKRHSNGRSLCGNRCGARCHSAKGPGRQVRRGRSGDLSRATGAQLASSYSHVRANGASRSSCSRAIAASPTTALTAPA